MGLYEDYGFNEELGTKGKWFKIKENDEAEFKIRFSGCSKKVKENFVKHSVEIFKIQEQMIKKEKDGKDLEENKEQLVKILNIGVNLIVENVLLDWRNFKWCFKSGEKPKNVKFSKENAKKILTQAEGILSKVSEIASNRKNFLEDETNVKKKSSSQSKRSSNTRVQKSLLKNSGKKKNNSQKL